MDVEITEGARRFLSAPRLADKALAERLDLLIELTQTTNRLLAKLVDQGSTPPPAPQLLAAAPVAEILPVDPPSAKRARTGRTDSDVRKGLRQ